MLTFFYDPEKLRENPHVYNVDRRSLLLRTDFRIKLFKLWKCGKTPEIAEELSNAGLGPDLVGNDYISILTAQFKNSGYPFPKKSEADINPRLISDNPLLASEKFMLSGRSFNGIVVSKVFEMELFRSYPEISLEEGIQRAGLDPLDVGYQRIRKIAKDFEDQAARINGYTKYDDMGYDQDAYPDYNDSFEKMFTDIKAHPYVKVYDGNSITMADFFYNEACLLSGIEIETLFAVYELNPEWFTDRNRMIVSAKLSTWIPTETRISVFDEKVMNIWTNRIKLMSELVQKGLEDIGCDMGGRSIEERRRIALWVDALPRDPWGKYTTRTILEIIGLPKSTYYELLHNENYGKGADRRKHRDDEDILLIRQVVEYKGYKKGYRQISMMMKSVTGNEMSPHRVMMLMRRYGMRTGIRKPSKNRKAMKELMSRNGKPNTLFRRFKLHRPNEVRLTDVTYLDYGNDLRAYGSACIDPVTSKLICFVVSENNDLQLALDTLAAMDEYPAKNGGIIHSDQGILYFTDDFQKAVKDRDLIQSMSRRGNCWDNAPQESFFGHFKDECDYKKCSNLEELRACIDDYRLYYNQERHMWDRLKMTPDEYEEYLSGLSDEEFGKYMSAEEEKYRKKKDAAAKKAVETAKGNRRKRADAVKGDNDETCEE
ncbi:MAG: IS3 family transposase [Butyrivibrio sp.]|nr:IS3 family transposase [Butyrivibrio sp.]